MPSPSFTPIDNVDFVEHHRRRELTDRLPDAQREMFRNVQGLTEAAMREVAAALRSVLELPEETHLLASTCNRFVQLLTPIRQQAGAPTLQTKLLYDPESKRLEIGGTGIALRQGEILPFIEQLRAVFANERFSIVNGRTEDELVIAAQKTLWTHPLENGALRLKQDAGWTPYACRGRTKIEGYIVPHYADEHGHARELRGTASYGEGCGGVSYLLDGKLLHTRETNKQRGMQYGFLTTAD